MNDDNHEHDDLQDDHRELLCLGNGWHVATAIRPDGSVAYWLVSSDAEGSTTVQIPRHEQTGPLPAHIRNEMHLNRCGAPRADGRPCRAYVSHPQDHCHRHQLDDATDRSA